MMNDNDDFPSREVNRICLTVLSVLCYQLASAPELILAVPSNLFRSFPDFIFYLVTYLLVVPALVLFYRQIRMGWALLSVYAVHMFGIIGYRFLTELWSGYFYGAAYNQYHFRGSGLFTFVYLVVYHLVFGWLIYLLFSRKVSSAYSVSAYWKFMIVAISLVLIVMRG